MGSEFSPTCFLPPFFVQLVVFAEPSNDDAKLVVVWPVSEGGLQHVSRVRDDWTLPHLGFAFPGYCVPDPAGVQRHVSPGINLYGRYELVRQR